jgi:GT2 family glycosyltransferase
VICAVVVTRDRLALLRDCLAALRAQTRAPDRILVVDNDSSDGTAGFLAEQEDVETLRLDHNAGGAGGFHAGLERAHATGAEWMWLMDDDTIPRPGALEALLRPDDAEAILRASVAVWTDGRLHPMNVPGLERERIEPLIEAAPQRLLPLRTSTFVSLLVHRSTVDRFGLPEARYFIWSDDIEYTARVTRGGGRMVLVTDSVVEHRTAKPHTAVTSTGDRFYYHARNSLFMVRGRSWSTLEKASLLYLLAVTSAQYVRGGGSPRVVVRGLRDGLAGRAATASPRG